MMPNRLRLRHVEVLLGQESIFAAEIDPVIDTFSTVREPGRVKIEKIFRSLIEKKPPLVASGLSIRLPNGNNVLAGAGLTLEFQFF